MQMRFTWLASFSIHDQASRRECLAFNACEPRTAFSFKRSMICLICYTSTGTIKPLRYFHEADS